MKKLVAVLAVLALVAGWAFAQVSVSGDVTTGVSVGSGVEDVNFDAVRTWGHTDASVEFAFGTADGVFGVSIGFDASFGMEIRNHGTTTTVPPWETAFFVRMGKAYAWWQPNRMFWMLIGGDDFFGQPGGATWDFYRAAGNVGVVDAHAAWHNAILNCPAWGGWISYENAFFDGFSEWGVMMTIAPIHELTLNFGIPIISMGSLARFDTQNWGEAGDVIQSSIVQALINQPWGNVALTYWLSPDDYDFGQFWGLFSFRGIDNLGLNLGLGLDLFGENHGNDTRMSIGLAAEYDITPQFGLRARTMGQFMLSDDDYFGLLFDVLPFFRMTENITIFCSIGFGMLSHTVGVVETSQFDWHFNPYVEIGTQGEWGPRFFAGFRLWSINDGEHINWAIPVGFMVGF